MDEINGHPPFQGGKNYVLVVEKDNTHAELILRAFKGDDNFKVARVGTLREARESTRDVRPDLVFVDLELADGKGMELIAKEHKESGFPVVIMTSADEKLDMADSLSFGAADYVVKTHDSFNEMPHIAERAIREWRHFITRKNMESMLHEHQAKLNSIFRAAPIGISVVVDRIMMDVNNCLCEITGYSSEELVGNSSRMLYADVEEFERVGRDHYLDTRDHRNCSIETMWRRKDGQLINVLLISTPVVPGNLSEGLTFIVVDITEQKKTEKEKFLLEEKLRKAQKMESIGRLAGGVAHDFNNLLTPILGYAEMLLRQVDPGDKKRDALMEIKLAAQRARDITRQLLAFGRQQTLELKALNLANVIRGFEKLLAHTVRENIYLEISTPDALTVNADGGQVEQVLMNLVVNAQDAMPDGGRITITLERVTIGQNYDGIKEDDYAMISVQDNGTGMTQETRDHLFEPFFTTKAVNKGNGLGLSTAYGIIRQHNGYIKVESEVGRGSVFRIYLPLTMQPVEENNAAETVSPGNKTCGETILLVEDDDVVRQVTSMMLEQMGYQVISTGNPNECIAILTNLNMKVDLLLTDVIMPEINGRELYRKISETRKGIKVLYMSGYPSNVILTQGGLEAGISFIQKPFSSAALEEKIQEAINRRD